MFTPKEVTLTQRMRSQRAVLWDSITLLLSPIVEKSRAQEDLKQMPCSMLKNSKEAMSGDDGRETCGKVTTAGWIVIVGREQTGDVEERERIRLVEPK